MDPDKSLVIEESDDDEFPLTQAPTTSDEHIFKPVAVNDNFLPSTPASGESIKSESEGDSMSTNCQRGEIIATLCGIILTFPDTIKSVFEYENLDIAYLKTNAKMLLKLEKHMEGRDIDSPESAETPKKRLKHDQLALEPTLPIDEAETGEPD